MKVIENYFLNYIDENGYILWEKWLEHQFVRESKQKPLFKAEIEAIGCELIPLLNSLKNVSFQEALTTAYVSDLLLGWGYKLIKNSNRKPHETEVIAVAAENPQLFVRVDLDAVSTGKNQCSHACGHDVNMAAVLTLAKQLIGENINVGFIFQPAEEGPGNPVDGYVHPDGYGGGQYLRAKGVYQDVPQLISCHIDTVLDSDEVRISYGQATTAAYRFSINIEGKMAHAALLAGGVNPISKLPELIMALELLNKEFKCLAKSDDVEYGLVTATQIHTAECELNSLAPSCKIQGISRICGQKSLKLFNDFMAKYNALVELEAPPIYNDSYLVNRAIRVASDLNLKVNAAPARFRDETAWAGPLHSSWVNDPEKYGKGCERILHFYTPHHNPESGCLHSDDFAPNYEKSIDSQVSMLLGLIKAI